MAIDVNTHYRHNANKFSTTLSSGISSAALTMNLTSIAGWAVWDEYAAASSSMAALLTDANHYTVFTISNADDSVVEVVYAYGPVTGATSIPIERAKEGTTPQTWPSGSKVEARVTVSHLEPGAMFNGYSHYNTDGSTPNLTDKFIVSGEAGGLTNQLCSYGISNTLALAPYFGTISVAGQSDVVGDSTHHGLTFLAGTGITITTNATTRELTFTSSGGGGTGDVVGPSSSVANQAAVFDGTTGKLLKAPTTGGVALSTGTTAQRSSTNYEWRWNTDLSHAEIRNSTWTDQQLLMEADFPQNGLLVKTGSLTYGGRTITGTTNYIDVSNGNGSGGNPTITISSSYPGGSSIATLGTVTSGTWNATIITVPYGGTGRATATAYAPLVGGTTSTGAHQSMASGSTGQIMQSAGSAAVPTWSTPTYPSSSGTSGKRLKSDGTNIVYSTTTMPDSGSSRKIIVGDGTNYVESTETWAVPGSLGNLLKSDGTNWIAAKATLTTDVIGVLPVANGGTNFTKRGAVDAYNSANQTGVVTATWTQVQYDTELTDSDSAFASNTFTAPETGNYLIVASISMSTASSDPGTYTAGIYINGTLDRFIDVLRPSTTDTGNQSIKLIECYFLGNGDTVKIYAKHTTTSNKTINGFQVLSIRKQI